MTEKTMHVTTNPTDMDRLHRMPTAQRWLIAARLKTLGLSVTPVLAGSWLAAQQGTCSPVVLVLTALSAALIQVGTNLWNDAADAARGTDGADRLGPPRLTSLGLLDGAAVKRAAAVSFFVSALLGLVLASYGGWPIIAVGAVSLLLGYAYSMGPLPLSHTPIGEVLVIAFFGIVAIAGTVHLHGQPVSAQTLLFGAMLGLPSAAVLLLNNHRDRVADARTGRRTLAILLGGTGSKALFSLMLCASVALLPLFSGSCTVAVSPTLLMAISAMGLIGVLWRTPISPAINRLLPLTALFQMGLLLAVAASAVTCA